MLESMTENHIPKERGIRCHHAVLDGSDYVMLSGETAVGLYPVECVDMMKHIIKFTEASSIYKKVKRMRIDE